MHIYIQTYEKSIMTLSDTFINYRIYFVDEWFNKSCNTCLDLITQKNSF